MSRKNVRDLALEEVYMQSIERRLEALLQHPSESLDVEIKDWLKIDEPLHKADY